MIRQSYRYRDRAISVELQRIGDGRFLANVDEEEHQVEARLVDSTTMSIVIDGVARMARVVRVAGRYHVVLGGETYLLSPETHTADGADRHVEPVSPEIIAPMPGKVLQVLVRAGQEVTDGDGLLILEAMKMENRIVAEAPATVRRVHVKEGQMIEAGTLLVELEYTEADSDGAKTTDTAPPEP